MVGQKGKTGNFIVDKILTNPKVPKPIDGIWFPSLSCFEGIFTGLSTAAACPVRTCNKIKSKYIKRKTDFITV